MLFRMLVPSTPSGIQADCVLHDGDRLDLGCGDIHVLHTPGHSPGGISLWLPADGAVICGDLLFRQGVGRTDFPGSSSQELVRSVHEKLFSLPDETTVYPGHGPETSIGYEKRSNPWVSLR
jgi:glyoxylase-like metal-dependent hydrolase (beta-lactamase superfamily II)